MQFYCKPALTCSFYENLGLENALILVHTLHMGKTVGLNIKIDPGSSLPVFIQIVDAVSKGVEKGAITPGTRLPATRTLAATLGVATNTVAKAYRELERHGVVQGRGRLGTYVLDRDQAATHRAAGAYSRSMKSLGHSLEEAQDYLAYAWS